MQSFISRLTSLRAHPFCLHMACAGWPGTHTVLQVRPVNLFWQRQRLLQTCSSWSKIHPEYMLTEQEHSQSTPRASEVDLVDACLNRAQLIQSKDTHSSDVTCTYLRLLLLSQCKSHSTRLPGLLISALLSPPCYLGVIHQAACILRLIVINTAMKLP